MSYKPINVLNKQSAEGGERNISSNFARPNPLSAASAAVLKPTTASIQSIPVNYTTTAAQAKELMKQEASFTRINIVKDPHSLPTASRETTTISYHNFQQFQPFANAANAPNAANGSTLKAPSSRKVNSKAEAKQSEVLPTSGTTGNLPTAFGATFIESIDRSKAPKPPHPTLPRVLPVLDQKDFQHVDGFLVNRTPNGRILGNAAQRYIHPSHVPYNPPEEPVGPSNPYQKLNDTWTKCWDDEAGAVYYYNNQTGEATWIQPEELTRL